MSGTGPIYPSNAGPPNRNLNSVLLLSNFRSQNKSKKKGFKLIRTNPNATSLVHRLSFKILKEVDKFAEDVPQNFNDFDSFTEYNCEQF